MMISPHNSKKTHTEHLPDQIYGQEMDPSDIEAIGCLHTANRPHPRVGDLTVAKMMLKELNDRDPHVAFRKLKCVVKMKV